MAAATTLIALELPAVDEPMLMAIAAGTAEPIRPTIMDRRASPRSYPKLNKAATRLLKDYCRKIRPFFRFALASALGEMAYP
jgi:hypothetical protein